MSIDNGKCPNCGNKLHWTYEIDEDKIDEDCRIYGVICSKCGYEKYDE